MSAAHTPGPQRQAMTALEAEGFYVSEVWLGTYFDGLQAVKTIEGQKIEIYSGGADNGDPSDLHYAPRVYINGKDFGGFATPRKSLAAAKFRLMIDRAAIAKAGGAA